MTNVQDTSKEANLFFNYICIRNPVFIIVNASDKIIQLMDFLIGLITGNQMMVLL